MTEKPERSSAAARDVGPAKQKAANPIAKAKGGAARYLRIFLPTCFENGDLELAYHMKLKTELLNPAKLLHLGRVTPWPRNRLIKKQGRLSESSPPVRPADATNKDLPYDFHHAVPLAR
jgi:hypothetical protein